MNLEEIATHLASLDCTKQLRAKLIMDALLTERRHQENIAQQQLKQAAPDLAGLQKSNAELLSKTTRMGQHLATLEPLVLRQRRANREDRETCYTLIKALEACSNSSAFGVASTIADKALQDLEKARPSIKRQMKYWKP